MNISFKKKFDLQKNEFEIEIERLKCLNEEKDRVNIKLKDTNEGLIKTINQNQEQNLQNINDIERLYDHKL